MTHPEGHKDMPQDEPDQPRPEIRVWIVEAGPASPEVFDRFDEANAQRERLTREGFPALMWQM